VDEAGEFDAWDVAGGAIDSFEVPDCFGSVLEEIGASVLSSARCGFWKEVRLGLGSVVGEVRTAWGRSRPGIHLSICGQLHGWFARRQSIILPPFFLEKIPVKPHGESSRGCTSWMSTTRTSPGSAVSISNGPVR